MTTTKSYDYLNRLQSISSLGGASGASPLSFHYAYNEANQRTQRSEADGSSWTYQYDSLGQVTSGKKFWGDDVPVAGQQFEYAFDDIGNRTATKTGGDANGGSLRSANYSANNLNQYISRDVPGTMDIIGAANPSAAVTVNNATTYRKGEYFHQPLAIANSSTNVWQGVTNKAVLSGTTNTLIGNTFLPKTAEVFSYDLDGNMTKDGRWSLVWDGENRLAQMIATNVVSSARKWLVFGYDWKGRRISKTVSNWTGSAWTVATRNKFVHDGWNLVAELNATNNAVIRRFVWGTDLSGSMQGAGGVGGLLALNDVAKGFHFAGFDGNGNVAGLVNGTNGTASAVYENGPFGEVIRGTGLAAKVNPFRFSTKFAEEESGFTYYGFRYYDFSVGRWPSRDAVGELGHEVLRLRARKPSQPDEASPYAFVMSDPIGKMDVLGESVADLVTKRSGGQIPKAVGVQAGGLLALKIPFVSTMLAAGSGVGVYFFPDSCEIGAFAVRAGIGSGIDDVQWYEMGAYAGLSASVEAAVFVGNSTPGVADARTFAGLFYTGQFGPLEGYVGEEDLITRGRWIGGAISAPLSSQGGTLVGWNYIPLGTVSINTGWRRTCLCYPAIAAL